MLAGRRARYRTAALVLVGVVMGFSFAAVDAEAATRTAKVAGVADGDTVVVRIAGRARKVHLEGVRSASARTCAGRLARRGLARLLRRGRVVRVYSRGRTFPTRRSLVGRIYIGRRSGASSVGRAQAARGWVRVRTAPNRRATHYAAYRRAERVARARRRGLWSAPCSATRVGPPAPSPAPAPPPPPPPPPGPPAPPSGVGLHPVVAGLDRPISLTGRPGGDDMVVAEQGGLVRIVRRGAVLADPLLDLTGLVNSGGGEVGLLGIAFHPRHAENGLFYVHYVDPAMVSRVVEYHVAAGSDAASSRAPRPIIAQQQPGGNHNGGQIAFGPDGYLYVAFGDGGAGGAASQDRGNLLGSIVRLDVDNPSAGLAYGIPPSNPFVGQTGVRGEIWAFGLRNPWRFSFDRANGDLWIGDVGENAIEEIDRIGPLQGGANFGWNAFEGSETFSGTLSLGPHVPPVAEYRHDITGGCSITGGFVYRGAEVPGLLGRYVYGDYCTGDVWSLDAADPGAHPTDLDAGFDPALNLLWSFGESSSGELYVSAGDRLYRFIAVAPT